MPIRSLSDLRKQAGADWKDSSDEDLISAYAGHVGLDAAEVANNLGFNAADSSKTSNRFGAAIDRYQAGLYGVGEAVSGALGFEGAESALGERRRANELAANVSSLRAREQGAIESYKDVKGLADAGDYVAGLAIQSAPYAAEALVGGIGTRALMSGTRTALSTAINAGDEAAAAAARTTLNRGSQAAAGAISYPSAVGDVLQNQREQADTTDLGSAAALGVPYAALNIFGIEGTLAKGQLFRSSGSLLDNISGVKGGAARATATGLRVGAAESFSETSQEGLNQLGRMAVDPNEEFITPQSVERFKESAVGGFVLGGVSGSIGGGFRRSEGSFLPGSTDSGNADVSNKPDNNAINNAIDSTTPPPLAPRPTPTSLSGWPDQLLNSTLQFQLAKGREANVELIQQIDAEIARRGGTETVDSQAQVRNAQLQQQQQAAQAQQQAAQAQAAQVDALRTDVFNKYGGQTTTLPGGTKPVFSFLGKQYFTLNDMNKAVDAVLAKEQTKPPMVREVEGALASVIPVVGAKPYTPAKMASFLNPYLNEAESIAEVADRIDARLASIKPNSPESDTLTALRNVLRGQPAEGNITQLNQGVNDGQLQLQGNAGLRTISEQGGATQTGGTGSVRPTNLQSVQPRSIDEGSLGLQVGAVPSGGVSTGPNAGRGGLNIPNAGSGQAQDQGQVNGRQPQVTTKKRRSVVPDQAAERARSPEQQVEEEATNLVETVVRNVIDAVVKRRGRMSNVNLQKLKDFIYYDFSQVENRKEGIAGLTKKELAEMFDVSTDTIDGWQDIANNFFEDNRGVIQAQLYQALDASGMSLLELKEQIQATREKVVNDAITLEEGQTLSEVTMEDEADFEQNAIEVAEAADQELTEMTTESQLDERELGAEDSGMTVMTGRKGASVQEQDKPEETINARYLRKANELEAAENSGDEELVAKLSKELDDLVNEATGVAKKQVAKSEAIAGEKKGTKDAVQKRSTKGVSVRKQAEAGQGVPSEDTEGGKVATKGKADEKGRSLTVVESKQSEEDFNTLRKLTNRRKDAERVVRRAESGEESRKAREKLQKIDDEIDAFNAEAQPRAQARIAALTGGNAKLAAEQDAQAWNALPVPVRYEQLSPQARADWALSVKDGKTNLAAASRVYDANEENIIDGTDLITEVGEEQQIKLLTYQVNKLSEEQTQRLEDHYGEDRESDKFFQKLREDVLNYVNKGAESVAKAIRDIIKSMQAGVMSMAVVFNPTMTSEPFKVAIPTYETSTTEIVAKVPDEAAKAMSPAAKRAYEVIYPAIKGQLIKNDKLFVVTDKPTATNFIFSPDGKVLFQSKVLIGKTEGNYYKGNNDIVDNRITPAGLYNMGIRTGGETAAGYDFNKVFGVEQVEDGSKYFITMMHSVYTKDSDAGQRMAALKEAGPQNSRYSFGCINVDKDTFGKILAGYEKQMDGAKLFIVPDGEENVMEFINGKAVYSSDMVREKVEPVTKTTKVPKKDTEKTDQFLAAKEEKATEETIKTTKRAIKARNNQKIIATESQISFLEQLDYTEHSIPGMDDYNGATLEVGLAATDLKSLSDNFPGIKRALFVINNDYPHLFDAIDHVAIGETGNFYQAVVTQELENGNIQTWLVLNKDHLLTSTGTEQAFAMIHEFGHIADMAGNGGAYSNTQQFELAYQELLDIYTNKTDRELEVILTYPFKGMDEQYQAYENIYLSKEELQQEVFAQLWAIGFNTVLTQKLKTLAPNAYNFIREVYSHAAEKRSVIPGSEAGSKIKTAVLKATFESRYSRSTAPSTGGLPGQPTIPSRTGKITLRKAIGQKAKPPELVKNGNKADLVVDGKVVSSFEVIPEKLYNAFKNNPQALANVERDNANYEEATNALEKARRAWQENQPYSRMEKMHIADSYTFYSLLTKATNGTATPEEQLAFDMAENGLRRRGPENYRRSLQPGNSIEESKIKFAKLQQEVNNGATTEQIAEEYAAQRKAPLTNTVIRRSRSLKEAREQSQKQMARLPKSVGGPLQELMDNIYGFAKKGLPTFAFTKDLADIASKLLPSAKKYVVLSDERDAIRTRLNLQVDKVLKLYDKLPESVKGTGDNSANILIRDFTEKGKWGYDPGWIKGGVTLDPELKARFEAMPAEAQNLIKAVFRHGQNTLLTMQKAVIQNINSEYDALIADAKKTGDKKEEAELTKKKAAALTDYSTLMRTNSKTPYAPLKRFGNYVVVGYSQQYLENEALSNSKTATPDVVAEAKKKLRELEKNEAHYFVQFAETRGEARAIAREEEARIFDGEKDKAYALVDLFEKDQSNSYGGRDVQNMFYRLRNMVEESKDANLINASEKAMNRLLADLHLTLLSEQSARQSERRRRGIAGAEKDMMRSFATQGRATANFIASLANTGSIYDVLREMKQEEKAPSNTSIREDRRRYYNEFMKRQFMGMDYVPSPYIDKALNVTSFWMLLTNPTYFLQNMTQAFMMSLPVIGAKHGYTKSWKEFFKAYTEIFNVIKDGGLNDSTYGKLPADVRSVVEELVNRGRIDISLEQDLGRWRSTEDSKLAKFGRVSDLLRSMAQNIETVNRVATAVAAYRLESKVSNPTRALNYADKLIYTTHGDYSVGNAPRFTRQGIGRLATQFRKFQLIQISLMARLYNDAFRNEDPDTRAIGKRALAFTIGHTAVVGGAMGLPGFYALAAIYGLLFGDDDEPFNAELELRRAIGNDALADLLVKGVPAAFGVDLSGKLGMGQMLSLFPYSNVDISRKGVYELVGTAVTGPFGALLGKTAEGISYMGQGEYYKGVEQMLPTGLASIAKAYRFATEGVTNRAGDVLLGKEEIDFVETMLTALGLSPKQITDRQFLQATKFEFDEFYNDKASEIKRAYTRASKENDTAAQAKAREDWKKLQESRAKNGYTKQPLSSLLKAPQEQRKRERNVAGGVQFNTANKGFVRQTSEL